VAIDLPGGSGFPQSHTDSGQALRKLAGMFPLTRQNIADDAVGPDQIDVPWSTWTPTWTNLTVGDGTQTARYIQIGKLVVASNRLVFGSTTAITGSISSSVPVAGSTTGNVIPVGQVSFGDTGTATHLGFIRMNTGATSLGIFTLGVGGASPTVGLVSATAPFTWVATDTIEFQITYQAA